MVNVEYANAYSEVLEILKYISKEDYNKIPENKIKLFEENANKDYVFKYNPNKTLDEQNASKITKGIVAILFRDYWATEIQRKKILSVQNNIRIKLEEEKRSKYNVNIFENKNDEVKDNGEDKSVNQYALVEYKESFFNKVIKKISSFFRKRQ